MVTHSHAPDVRQEKHHHFEFRAFLYRLVKVLLPAVLFLLFFLLARDLAQHRFSDGGWYTRSGSIRP